MWNKSPYTHEDLPHPSSKDPKASFGVFSLPEGESVRTYTYWPGPRASAETWKPDVCRLSVWWLSSPPTRRGHWAVPKGRPSPSDPTVLGSRARGRAGERSVRLTVGAPRRFAPLGSAAHLRSRAQGHRPAPHCAARGACGDPRLRRRETNPSLEEKETGAEGGGQGSLNGEGWTEILRAMELETESRSLPLEGLERAQRDPAQSPLPGPHSRLQRLLFSPDPHWPPPSLILWVFAPLLPSTTPSLILPLLSSMRDGPARTDPGLGPGSPHPPRRGQGQGQGEG